jgi:glutathione S-transferase
MPSHAPIRVFTFPPAFGLPTMGPFGLKLIACLSMLEVPFELAFEADARKGPKRKSPWIEDAGTRMGDTELILEHLARTRGVRLDAGLAPPLVARGHALRRMLEEGFHQVFEHELILDDAGFAVFGEALRPSLPRLVFPLATGMMRRSLRSHLYERGLARHTPAEIESIGRADVDALVAQLGDQPSLLGEAPSKVDAIAFGLLAVMVRSEIPTPVARHLCAQSSLVRFVDRCAERFAPRGARSD